MEQLATILLVTELNRRLDIINSETTDLREQMINDLTKDLEQFYEIEKLNIIDAVEWNYKSNMGEVYLKSKFK